MDGYLLTAGFSTSSIVLIGLIYKLGKATIGRRLISDCCGKNYEVGIDIRDMPHSPRPRETSHPRLEALQSLENLHESQPKERTHLPTTESVRSVQMHLPQQVVEEEIAPESAPPAIVAPTQSEHTTDQQSTARSFWPRSLLEIVSLA
jgi:hypothetical protein